MKQAEIRIRLKSKAQLDRIKRAAKLQNKSLQKFGLDSLSVSTEAEYLRQRIDEQETIVEDGQ